MSAVLEGLMLDESSTRALVELTEDGLPTASLIILEAALPDLALAAAKALAEGLLTSEAFSSDFHLAVPERDRWSIAELDELVLRPANLVPLERNLVLVHRAERADVSAAEHLLKTLEEPPGRTLFCFIVEDAAQLLPTIRGRAGRTLRLTAAAPQERARRLSALWGMSEEEASTLVAHAGAAVSLADSIAALAAEERAPLTAALAVFAEAPLRSERGTADSVALLSAIEELASVQAQQLRERDSAGPGERRKRSSRRTASKKKTADPVTKALTRELVRAVCARWRAELVDELRGVQTASGMASVEAGLVAVGAAEQDLAAYASPLWVLAAARGRTLATPGEGEGAPPRAQASSRAH